MELTDIQPTTDLTADSILTTTDQSGADDVTSFAAGKERDISVSGATFEDKRLAFGDSFKQVNGVVGLYDWFNSDMTADMESIFDTKDPLFVDQWNETNKLEYLEQQGFGIEQYSRISQAGSAESLQLITDGINKDITRQTNISENLSQGWQTAGRDPRWYRFRSDPVRRALLHQEGADRIRLRCPGRGSRDGHAQVHQRRAAGAAVVRAGR